MRLKKNNGLRTLHIFGGGPLVGMAENIAISFGWRVVIRTGQRFSGSFGYLNSDTPVFFGDDLPQLMFEGGVPKEGDIGLSFSAPWVFTQEIIDLFSGEVFNLHSQPLPKFMGAGGTSWSILMREKRGGCCIHRLIRKIDAGDVHARIDFAFPDSCRFPVDFDQYGLKEARALLGSWLTVALRDGFVGNVIPVADSEAEYWPRLNSDIHGWIDWSWSLSDIESFCNAFSFPHKGAMSFVKGDIVRIKKVRVMLQPNKFHPFQRGMVFRISDSLYVSHPDGVLIIDDYDAAALSSRIMLGDRFFTPPDKISAAMSTRVQYLPSGCIVKS